MYEGGWYVYENGDQKIVFKCVGVDGEYLLFNKTQGYSLIACRPATLKEISEDYGHSEN
jgi:hypothetical protein